MHTTVRNQSTDPAGTFPCKHPRCRTCQHVNPLLTVDGPKCSTNIKEHFSCDSSNLIDCISCRKCSALYIGETGRNLQERFSLNISSVVLFKTTLLLPLMKGEARNVWYLNNFLALLYLFTFFTLIHPSATQYYELLFVIYEVVQRLASITPLVSLLFLLYKLIFGKVSLLRVSVG